MANLRGKGQNSFDNDILGFIYDDCEDCVNCMIQGKISVGADAFDHNIPRSSIYANSILNAIPVHNRLCNLDQHGKMHQRENQEKMFEITLKRLKRENYKLTELDKNYIKKYNFTDIAKKYYG